MAAQQPSKDMCMNGIFCVEGHMYIYDRPSIGKLVLSLFNSQWAISATFW